MPDSRMKIVFLAHTEEPLRLIYNSYRQCYNAGFVGDDYDEAPLEKMDAFVREMLPSGHLSPLEHVSLSFAVSGVSRALTHQLVRHRIASYSQQSQRYVDGSEFDYVIPPKIANDPLALRVFNACMFDIRKRYTVLKKRLEILGSPTALEDARFVLPQAAQTRIVFTMNCRSLLSFFEQRCCKRAQWEIRALADIIRKECVKIVPAVFEKAGAKCERLGFCPEGPKFSCGLFPCRQAE